MSKNIITCASYGGTGSSVITDLLKEFDIVKSTGDFEVSIAHEYGGISDLEHFLVNDFHRLKNDEAIYNFKKLVESLSKEYNTFFDNKFTEITNEYVDNLIQEQWEGYWHQHQNRVSGIEKFLKYKLPDIMERIKYKLNKNKYEYEFVPKQTKSKMYLTINTDKFYNETKKYFKDLFNTLDFDDKYKYLAIDQLVPPTNVKRYSQYFDSLKVIVVDRDPRDLYILNKLYWKEGWIPTENVKTYINWFKALRVKENDEPNVLRVNFEDFIVDYDNTILKVLKFLNLQEKNHVDKFKYFDPKKSKKNYKLYEKDEILTDKLKIELQMIESKLSEFIIK